METKKEIKVSEEAVKLMDTAKNIELACKVVATGIQPENDEVIFNLVASKTPKVFELQKKFWNLIYKDNPDHIGSALTYNSVKKEVTLMSSLNSSISTLFSELNKRLIKEDLVELASDVKIIQDKYNKY